MLPDQVTLKQDLSSIHFFNHLEEAELDFVLDLSKSAVIRQGQIIYDRGDLCNGFFIIISGKVTVFKYSKNEHKSIATLNKGDFFGEEILGNASAKRQTMAKAEVDTVLVKFSRGGLEDIVRHIPSLQQPFSLLLHSFELKLKKSYAWQEPGEIIQYIARKHPYVLINSLIMPIILGLIALIPVIYLYTVAFPGNIIFLILGILILIAGIFWSGWKGWDWTNDYYIITNHRILNLEKVALFYESRQETPLEAIQSIETKTDQLGRWLAFGDIALRTFTGLIQLTHLEAPEWVAALIQDYWARAKSGQIESTQQDVEEDIRQRFILKGTRSPQLAQKLVMNPVPANVESGQLTSFLASLFKLREESGDTLIYRTHWWILVRKTWMPLLLLLCLFGYLIAGASGAFGGWDIVSFFSFALAGGLFLWLWLLYQYVDWRNDVYMITPDQIVDINRKPLGKEEKRSAPLRNIQTIEYKRLGLIGLMLNFGTVFIRIGDAEFTFDYVDDPSRVQKELFERFMRFNTREKERDIEAERGRIADYLDAYHRMVGEDGQPSTEQKPDDFG